MADEKDPEHVQQMLDAFRKIYGDEQVDFWQENEKDHLMAKINTPWDRLDTEENIVTPDMDTLFNKS